MIPKFLGLFAGGLFAMAAPGIAQTAGQNGAVLGGFAAPPAAGKTCVQVQVAGQSAGPFTCLNQELQNQALAASGQAAIALPLGASRPSNATGTFNETGLTEQYGKNFGVSAVPYRPPPPVFNSSLH